MGATLPTAAVFILCRGGDPPGEEFDVRLDCCAALSKRLNEVVGFDEGEDVLFARERRCCCCC